MSMPPTATSPKWMIWAGRVISALPVLMLIFSGVMKFNLPDDALKQMTTIGWEPKVLPALAIVELGAAVLYIIPQTAVLGAILITGYLGGAIATHVRVADYSGMSFPIHPRRACLGRALSARLPRTQPRPASEPEQLTNRNRR
jgi:uncharacterized membrane protein YphA (DoxX/SURF4 family)